MTGGPRPLFAPAPDPLAAPLDEIAADLLPVEGPRGGLVQQIPLPDIPEDAEPVPYAARVRAVRDAPVTRSESAIVEELLGWLNVQPRVIARKVHQTAVTGSGEPDLDICWRGRAVKVEVKRPGQIPTTVQLRRMLQYGEAGALAGWVTSLEDLRSLLAHVDEPAYRPDLATPGA